MTGEGGGPAPLPTVHLIGTGLIGASLGLALVRSGAVVTLEDQSVTTVSLARDLGAGQVRHRAAADAPAPDVVVVATPPDITASVVLEALRRWPEAVVTDVASVKGLVLRELQSHASPQHLRRYAGSHPMAGRERSGAAAARPDLFEGRAWVLCPHEGSDPAALDLLERLARAAGAAVITLDASDHDAAVAAVSHVPQVMASLTAARLEPLSEQAVALAGQGVRDVTRIAASDPGLWTQILAGNAPAVADVLRHLASDLTEVIGALEALSGDASEDGVDAMLPDAPGARAALARRIAEGNEGRARLPGKHGSGPAHYTVVTVVVGDRPGELARLLADVGEAGVNLEDLRLDHGLGLPFGIAEVAVLPAAAAQLREALDARGWQVHD